MKNPIIFLFPILLCGCGVSNTQYESLKREHEKLQEVNAKTNEELSLYKRKFGEMPVIDPQNDRFGIWSINRYVDDFGEQTGEGYVSATVYGTFSNSATTDSELTVLFLIDYNTIRIKLYEYSRNHPMKSDGIIDFKVKDKNGEIHEFRTYNNSEGNNRTSSRNLSGEPSEDYSLLINLFKLEGNLSFVGIKDRYGNLSKYKFEIKNTSGFAEAAEKLGLK